MVIPVTVASPGFPGSFGSPFGPVNTVTLAANGTQVLPLGNWVVSTGSHDTVTFAISTGTTLTLGGVNSVLAKVISDGQNVEILNNGTAGTASTYLQILGL